MKIPSIKALSTTFVIIAAFVYLYNHTTFLDFLRTSDDATSHKAALSK